MNQAFIAGHLGSDPEVRFTSSGQKVTTMRVGARGRKGESIWWRVSVWGEQFDKMIAYLKKGSPIMIFGEISKPDIYTDKEGKAQTSLHITATNLLFSPFGRPDGSSAVANPSSQMDLDMALSSATEAVSGQGKMDLPFSDEELPF